MFYQYHPQINSTVFSQQLMKAGTIIHVLRRILHFRWLGQTVLRIHLSHGVYANFKVNFSYCVSSQISYCGVLRVARACAVV